MDKLKPCPFCGLGVRMTYSSWDNMYHIWHQGDLVQCAIKEPIDIDGYFAKSLKDASRVWNRRVDDAKR